MAGPLLIKEPGFTICRHPVPKSCLLKGEKNLFWLHLLSTTRQKGIGRKMHSQKNETTTNRFFRRGISESFHQKPQLTPPPPPESRFLVIITGKNQTFVCLSAAAAEHSHFPGKQEGINNPSLLFSFFPLRQLYTFLPLSLSSFSPPAPKPHLPPKNFSFSFSFSAFACKYSGHF